MTSFVRWLLAKYRGRDGVQFRAAPLEQIGRTVDDDFGEPDKSQRAAGDLLGLLGAAGDENAKRLRLRITHRNEVLRRDHEGHRSVLRVLVCIPGQQRRHIKSAALFIESA